MTRFDVMPSLSAWDLRVIVAVAEQGTLVAAAELLKVSQSSLSRIISRMEKELNVTLFSRSTRKMELTLAGGEFVAIAGRILNDLHLAYANMQELAAEKRGQILVSTYPQIAQEVLPALIAGFRESRGNVEIHVRTGRTPEVIDDINGGLADFGITFGEAVPDTIECVRLRRDRLCALIPTSLELGKTRAPLSFSKLDGSVMVSLPHDTFTRRLIDGAAAAAHISLVHAVTVPGFFEQMKHTRAGVGISLVPISTLPGPCPKHVAVREIRDPQLNVSINMLSLRGRHMSPAAASFQSMVIKHFRTERQERKVS